MKTSRYLVAALLCLALLPGVSCAKGETPPATTAPAVDASTPGAAAPVQAAAATMPAGTSVAAMVNGTPVTTKELMVAVKNTSMRMGMGAGHNPALFAQVGPQLLDQLVTAELLFQQARKDGFEAPAEKVEASFKELSSNFKDPQQFQKEMTDRGYTEESLRRNIAKQLTIQDYIDKTIAGKISVTEAEARTYYDQNPDEFRRESQIRASHILIGTEANDPPEKQEAARKKAEEIAAEAKKPGADFGALARQHSSCPSAAQGGDLGAFGRGKMVKPFEDAAFSLTKDEVSGPVQTEFGYHVIKVTDILPSSVVSFGQVGSQVQMKLKNERISKGINDRIQELYKSGKVEVLISFPPPPPSMGGHGGMMR